MTAMDFRRLNLCFGIPPTDKLIKLLNRLDIPEVRSETRWTLETIEKLVAFTKFMPRSPAIQVYADTKISAMEFTLRYFKMMGNQYYI